MIFHIYNCRNDFYYKSECIYQTDSETTAADYVDEKNSQLADRGLPKTWYYINSES